jgi:hypothetical protein
LSFPRQWSQPSKLEEPPITTPKSLRGRGRTTVVIEVLRQIVELLDSISIPEKRARAVAVGRDTVDQRLPSACLVLKMERFRNQRKIRCNRSDWPSFSKRSWSQFLSGMKSSAYWPSILQADNV